MGDTSQEAINGALKLALRHVSERFNAAEVERIELTQYPWFFLARVRVYPYRIQQHAVLAEVEEAEPMATRTTSGAVCAALSGNVSAFRQRHAHAEGDADFIA